MGRVMRLDSHLHLPPQDRVVKVIRWHGIVPRPGTAPTAPIDLTGSGPGPSSAQAIDASAEHLISADERVADINAQKRAALRAPQQLLRQIGLTNLRELYLGAGAAAGDDDGLSGDALLDLYESVQGAPAAPAAPSDAGTSSVGAY